MSDRPDEAGAGELKHRLTGGEPDITLEALAAAAGITPEAAGAYWHALGFPDSEPPQQLYTGEDKDAIVRLVRLVADAESSDEFALHMVRAVGHHMARLAMWQVLALFERLSERAGDTAEGAARAVEFLHDHTDDMEPLITYAWRRHVAAAVEWRLRRVTEDPLRMRLSVGFADMAGYTRLSREMDPIALARLVNRFEAISSDAVLRGGGRVIKTVGDEVMFAADTAGQAITVALDLASAMTDEADVPDVRVGVATGEVVARMGDVYGHTVNLASRLTGLARPGRVLTEGATAAALTDSDPVEAATIGEAVLQDFGTVHMFGVRRRGESRPIEIHHS